MSLPFKKRKVSPSTYPNGHSFKTTDPTCENIKNGTVSAGTESKPTNNSVAPKRKYHALSEGEKMEVLALIGQEFDRVLASEGFFREPVTTMFEKLRYKGYPAHIVIYTWRKLTLEASNSNVVKTPLRKEVLRLLRIYRLKKITKKVNVFGAGRTSIENVEKGETGKEAGTSKDIPRPEHVGRETLELEAKEVEAGTSEEEAEKEEEASKSKDISQPEKESVGSPKLKANNEEAAGTSEDVSQSKHCGRPRLVHNISCFLVFVHISHSFFRKSKVNIFEICPFCT